jgi:hypothetical protein
MKVLCFDAELRKNTSSNPHQSTLTATSQLKQTQKLASKYSGAFLRRLYSFIHINDERINGKNK